MYNDTIVTSTITITNASNIFSLGNFEMVPNSEADGGARTVIACELKLNIYQIKENTVQ